MTDNPQVHLKADMDGLCFGCGQNNAIGLKLDFKCNGDVVSGVFRAGKQFQGWPGFVHGGIIACILDEAMGRHFENRKRVTVKLEVRFIHPAPLEEHLIVTSSVVRDTDRLVEAKAKIVLSDGTIIAESLGLFVYCS